MSTESELTKSVESLSIGASSSSSKPEKQVLVITSDDVKFSIDESVAMEIETLKNMIEDDCAYGAEIPLSNIPSNMLTVVLDYCTKMAKFTASPDYKEMKKMQKSFVEVDDVALADMVIASNYLSFKSLFDISVQEVADRIRDMTVQECRDYFGIVTDIKPEDEDEVRRESAYAFE